jgi:Fe-S-cluster-containing hydrogenase component 2
MAFTVNPLTCPQNHKCPIINICPIGAITQTGIGLPVIDETLCTECGKCAKYCPMKSVGKKP